MMPVSPPAIDEAYRRIAPAYREVFCGIGAGAMRLAKQLLWQQSAFPAEFGRRQNLSDHRAIFSRCGSAVVRRVKSRSSQPRAISGT